MLKLAVFIFSFFLVGCDSQYKKFPNGPGVRNAHGFVYDETRQSLLLFGGASDEAVLGDTWSWSPDDGWERIDGASPGARTFPAMAFFLPMGGTVLFGGNRVLFGTGDEKDTFLNDTWMFSEGDWRKLDVDGPPPRAEASIAYDSQNQRLIMFGGYIKLEDGDFLFYDDTWTFAEGQWQKLSVSAPHPQSGTAMVFDRSLGKVILIGRSQDRSAPQMWVLEDDGWNEFPAIPGNPLYNPAMVYDQTNNRLVVFGGYNGMGRSNITWVRKDNIWTKDIRPGPVGRNHTNFAYDPVHKHSILFGGHNGQTVFGDLWMLDNDGWKLMESVPQKERIPNDH